MVDLDPVYPCFICNEGFSNRHELNVHKGGHNPPSDFELLQQAHEGACLVYCFTFQPAEDGDEFQRRIGSLTPKLKRLLKNVLLEKKFMKAALILTAQFIKGDEGGEQDTVITPIRSKTERFDLSTQLDEKIAQMLSLIMITLEDFTQNGSGWVLDSCMHFDVEINECLPL